MVTQPNGGNTVNWYMTEHLNETSQELEEALSETLGGVFGRESIQCGPLHTGGGVMVMAIDLSLDARGIGRSIWLTREGEREWLIGFYDFGENVEDEGICLSLNCPNDYSVLDGEPRNLADSPMYVASQVAGVLSRLGVSKLQGE